MRIVEESAERALAVIVIVALELEVADDRLGPLKAPVGQQYDVIAIEGVGIAGFRCDHDCPVKPGLLLNIEWL